MIDDVAMREYWLWVDASNPGVCTTCSERKKVTRKFDGRRICKDCYDQYGTERPADQ